MEEMQPVVLKKKFVCQIHNFWFLELSVRKHSSIKNISPFNRNWIRPYSNKVVEWELDVRNPASFSPSKKTWLWGQIKWCSFRNFLHTKFVLRPTKRNNWHSSTFLQVLRKSLDNLFMSQLVPLLLEKKQVSFSAKKSDQPHMLAISVHKICDATIFPEHVSWRKFLCTKNCWMRPR